MPGAPQFQTCASYKPLCKNLIRIAQEDYSFRIFQNTSSRGFSMLAMILCDYTVKVCSEVMVKDGERMRNADRNLTSQD